MSHDDLQHTPEGDAEAEEEVTDVTDAAVVITDASQPDLSLLAAAAENPAPATNVGPAAASPAGGALQPYPSPFARAPRPVLGPLLSVFGALLWSFVVAGQLTTSWMSGAPLGEDAAALAVLVATSASLVFALRRSRVVPMRGAVGVIKRSVLVSVLSFVCFLGVFIIATIIGNVSSSNRDFAIAFGLVAIAIAASYAGPRLTVPQPYPKTHGQRFATVATWIGAVIVTLIAGAELASNG